MAAILASDVEELVPAVPAASVSTLTLAVANKIFAVDIFDGEEGEITKMVRCLFAAHMTMRLAAGDGSGAVGPLTSISEGGMSRSYGALMSSSFLATTVPGSELLSLIQAFGGGAWLGDPYACQ